MNFYKIEPDLSNQRVSTIENWGFTYWPNKPKSQIIRNPDGTFTVWVEKDFIPLVNQLQNLFEDNQAPESGTYIGEAILKGALEPTDFIYGNFINRNQGVVISLRLLEIFRKYKLPEHFVYELPLVKKRKQYDNYVYLHFQRGLNDLNCDVRLIIEEYTPQICVSESLKEEICKNGIKGCYFIAVKK